MDSFKVRCGKIEREVDFRSGERWRRDHREILRVWVFYFDSVFFSPSFQKLSFILLSIFSFESVSFQSATFFSSFPFVSVSQFPYSKTVSQLCFRFILLHLFFLFVEITHLPFLSCQISFIWTKKLSNFISVSCSIFYIPVLANKSKTKQRNYTKSTYIDFSLLAHNNHIKFPILSTKCTF